MATLRSASALVVCPPAVSLHAFAYGPKRGLYLVGANHYIMAVLARRLIFLAATASKAWEPLAVDLAGHTPYLFAAALVLCEVTKLAVLLPALAFSHSQLHHQRVSWRTSALHYGLPSLSLAICNLCLGYAVPRLGALLYQIFFQLATVSATGLLAMALLSERITLGQWAALALLTVGSLGAIAARTSGGGGGGSNSDAGWPPPPAAVLSMVLGALALSLNTVLSERAARDAPSRSTLQKSVDISAWGVAATAVLFCVLHGADIATGAVASLLAGFGQPGPWLVIISIAAADLTMVVFCMADGLGANAYSVSRALAMVASVPLANAALGTRVSAAFAASSAAVAAGGYLFAYHKPERQPSAHRSRSDASLEIDTEPLMEGRTHAGAVELSVSDRSPREIE